MAREESNAPRKGGKHRWTPKTGWANTVAGEIEHAQPGTEAPKDLGHRDHEPRHARSDDEEMGMAA